MSDEAKRSSSTTPIDTLERMGLPEPAVAVLQQHERSAATIMGEGYNATREGELLNALALKTAAEIEAIEQRDLAAIDAQGDARLRELNADLTARDGLRAPGPGESGSELSARLVRALARETQASRRATLAAGHAAAIVRMTDTQAIAERAITALDGTDPEVADLISTSAIVRLQDMATTRGAGQEIVRTNAAKALGEVQRRRDQWAQAQREGDPAVMREQLTRRRDALKFQSRERFAAAKRLYRLHDALAAASRQAAQQHSQAAPGGLTVGSYFDRVSG